MREREIEFGRLVRDAREAAGYSSQPKLADAARVSTRSVANVERGEIGVGRKVRAAIARVLGWDPHQVEDFIAGRLHELPDPARKSAAVPTQDAADQRNIERILSASPAELVRMFREEVETRPGMTRAHADQWLVDVLEMRAHALRLEEAAKRSVS